jgi:ribosomal protein S12 methylthiotransferase
MRKNGEQALNVFDGSKQLNEGKYWVARGEADAPDIDGRVYVMAGSPKSEVHSPCGIGEFATVKIVGHTDYDLIAELV